MIDTKKKNKLQGELVQTDLEARLNFWMYAMEIAGNLFRIDLKPEELEKIFIDTVMEIMRVKWSGFFAQNEKEGEFILKQTKPVMKEQKGFTVSLTTKQVRLVEKEQKAMVLPPSKDSHYYPVSTVFSNLFEDQKISLMLPFIASGTSVQPEGSLEPVPSEKVTKTETKLMGFLILGDREANKSYSPEELRYLNIIGKQFTQALNNLNLVEELALQRQKQIEQLEGELRSLSQLGGGTGTTVTAKLFGRAPISESATETFNDLTVQYEQIMNLALDQRGFKVEHNIPERLKQVARELGFLGAGPRDVIEIHSASIKAKRDEVTSKKLQAYVEEGRLLILELMGYLLSYYRNLSMGSTRKAGELETN